MPQSLTENSGQQFINCLSARQRERIMPFSVTFELTPLCNFRCKMCYIRLDPDQLKSNGQLLSTDEWLSIATEAQAAGVYKITFTGGEVFTHPDFQRIYKTVYDMGFHISIISNGYLIDQTAIAWLKKRKPDFIKITIYGASDETYKKVCGIDGGFTKVTSNIRRLRENGVTIVTCMTVIQENENDIEQVKHWAENERLKLIISKVIRKSVGQARSDPEGVRTQFNVDDKTASRKVKHAADLFPPGNGSPFENCLGYHNACIIGWDGIVKACNFINSNTVDIRGRKLVDCFKELWEKLDRIKRPEKCKHCKYLRFCNPCPGKLEGESGNPEEPSPYVCDLAKWCYYNRNLDKNDDSSLDNEQCE